MFPFRRRVFYGGVFYFLFMSFLFAQIPGQLSDWRQAAKDAITQNDITLAVFYYQQIQQSFADTSYATDAQCRIVSIYLQSNQPDKTAEALSRLKQNYSSRPEYVQLVHELGWEFVKKRDYAAALRIYKDLQAQFPAHQRAAWFGRSVVQTYLEAGDIAGVRQAVEDLKNNYASHPDYAGQMNSTANRLRGKRQYEIAETIYSHLLARLPGHKDAVVWKRMRIQNLLDMGQADSAKTEVETLWSAYKDRPEFVKQAHELGWEFVRKGDYATGLRIYKGLLEEFANHERAPWFRRSIVQTYLEAGETQKALEAVEQMKDNFAAENSENHRENDLLVRQMERLMNNLLDKSQPAEAKKLSGFLLEKLPNQSRLVWLLHYKARSEVAMKEPNLADATVEVMRQQCGTDPNYAEALSWTAYNYRKAGCCRRAIELYEEVLGLNPDKVIQLRCIANIAQAYVRLDDDAKVQEKLDYILSSFKDNPEGTAFYMYGIGEEYLLMADELFRTGRRGEINQKCQKAIPILEPLLGRLTVTEPVQHAWYSMGTALRLMGDYENAAGYYQATVDFWPDYIWGWNAQYFVGYCYEMLKEQNGTDPNLLDTGMEEAYRRMVEKYPDSGPAPLACLKLGDLCLRQKRYAEAAAYYERYQVKARPNDPFRERIKWDLAWLYDWLGDTLRSRALYEEILRDKTPDLVMRQMIIERELNRRNQMENAR